MIRRLDITGSALVGTVFALALLVGVACSGAPNAGSSGTASSSSGSSGSAQGGAAASSSSTGDAGGSMSTSSSSASSVSTSSSSSSSSSSSTTGTGGAGGSTNTGGSSTTGVCHGFPLVTKGSGAVLQPVRVVTIVASGDPHATELFSFGDALVESAWFTAVGADYGLGAAGPSVHLTGATVASGTVLDEAAQEKYISDAIATTTGAEPDGKTVYVFYLPAGVSYELNGFTNTDCTGFDGYHLPYGSLGDGYAILQQCQGTFASVLDELEVVASHEILEAATDPAQPNGWTFSLPAGQEAWSVSPWAEEEGLGNVEIGDFCVGTKYVEGGFSYQRIYSNTAVDACGDPCVPPLGIPYFNVEPVPGWTQAGAGSSASVSLRPWTTGVTASWVLSSDFAAASGPDVNITATVQSPTQATIAGRTWPTANVGTDVTLAVDVPAGTPSGSWIVFQVFSFHLDANGYVPAGEDLGHQAVVGVYVP